MKIAHGTLVMVADGEKLLLFRNEGDEKYPVLSTLTHEEQAHLATHEQGADGPGRSFASSGERRSALNGTDWHQQDEERFAIHAANVLENAAGDGNAGIVVLAPPRMLGVLRKHWGPQTQERLLAEINKDFSHHMTDEVIAAIAAKDAETAERQGDGK